MRTTLSAEAKTNILHDREMLKMSQDQLAAKYGVHRRTIGRTLREKGEPPTLVKLSKDDSKILAIAKNNQLTPAKLKKLLKASTNEAATADVQH